MLVITNEKSATATQTDPFYRSSLAQHTRRQIELLQANRVHDHERPGTGPVDSSLAAKPESIAVPSIDPNPSSVSPIGHHHPSSFRSVPSLALFTPSVGTLSSEAIRVEPTLGDNVIPAAETAVNAINVGIDTSGPTLAQQQSISPISANGTTDTDSAILSPAVSNIWQLDPTHDLASIGLAFGLDTSPKTMSGPQPLQPSYGWAGSMPEPLSAQSDRGTYPNEGPSRPLSYPSSNSAPYSAGPTLNTGYPQQPYTGYYSNSSVSGTAPRNASEYGSIDPARLNNGPGGYMRNYEGHHSRLSPMRSPTESPLLHQNYNSYPGGQAGPSAGPMSAREATFNHSITGYGSSRLRRHSDEYSAFEGPRLGGSAAGKRKATWSGGDTDLASIKQELDFLAQTEREVAELKNDLPQGDRKERRRMQNRLAQRAFRARSKVHHQEVSKHITELEDTVDSQADHIDKLMSLVERLQTENMLLRKATDWSSLGIPNDTPRLDDHRQQPPHH